MHASIHHIRPCIVKIFKMIHLTNDKSNDSVSHWLVQSSSIVVFSSFGNGIPAGGKVTLCPPPATSSLSCPCPHWAAESGNHHTWQCVQYRLHKCIHWTVVLIVMTQVVMSYLLFRGWVQERSTRWPLFPFIKDKPLLRRLFPFFFGSVTLLNDPWRSGGPNFANPNQCQRYIAVHLKRS